MNEEDQDFRNQLEDEMQGLQEALQSGRVTPAARAIRVGGRQEAKSQSRQDPSSSAPSTSATVLGEVKEREVSSICGPPGVVNTNYTAFPLAMHRQELNLGRKKRELERGINTMSKEAILEAQKEIKSKLKPKTIQFLKERALQKQNLSKNDTSQKQDHSKTNNLQEQDSSKTNTLQEQDSSKIESVQRQEISETDALQNYIIRLRFSLDGEVVDLMTKEELQNSGTVEERAMKRDPVIPDQSYTLHEMLALIMGSFRTHRAAGLRFLKNTILKSKTLSSEKIPIPERLTEDENLSEEITWNKVWSCLVHDLDCCSLLRTLVKDRSQSKVQTAVQVLEIIISNPQESAWTDISVQHPRTASPVIDFNPLERSSMYENWQKTEFQNSALLFLQLMHRQMQTGIIEDLYNAMEAFPVNEVLLPVIKILSFLGSLNQSFCQKIIDHSKFWTLLKEWLGQDLGKLQLMILRLLSRLLERSPGSCAKHFLSHEILDLIRSHLSAAGVIQEHHEEILVLLFRIWRLCCTENVCFVSLDDLFAVFEFYLEPCEFQKAQFKVSQELYLCLATAMGKVQNCRICPLSKQCASVLIRNAIRWIQVDFQNTVLSKNEDIQLGFYDCLSAVFLFLNSCLQRGLTPEIDLQDQLKGFVKNLTQNEAIDKNQDFHTKQIVKIHFWSCLMDLMDTVGLELRLVDYWQFEKPVRSIECISLNELDDFVKMQYRTHWGNFSFSHLNRNLDDSVETLSWNLELLTLLPPGFESKAILALKQTLTPKAVQKLLETTNGVLEDANHPQDPARISSVLVNALVSTWYGDKKLTKLEKTQTELGINHVDLKSLLESNLPLGDEYLFLSLKQGHNDALLLLQFHLWLLLGLEMTPSCWIQTLNPYSKLKRLLQLVFLTTEQSWEDVFIVNIAKELLKLYLSDTVVRKDSPVFWENEFVERLVMEYCLISCGDSFFGQVIALMFLTDSSLETKTLTWKILEENKLLHAIPAMESWIGGQSMYSPNPQQYPKLKSMIIASKSKGSLIKSQRLGSGISQWIKTYFHDL